MLVAAVQVYFRDLKSFLPYVLRVWLYVSPVLYFAERGARSRYKFLLDANPLGAAAGRVGRRAAHRQRADAHDSSSSPARGRSARFVVGALFFMSREREFAVRL